MKKVLFVCWYNSARSQMAEAMLRKFGGEKFDVYSAGIEAGEIKPQAVEVMKEIDVDMSGQTPKKVDGFVNDEFDEVITVCDSAQGACPVIPGAKHVMHWSVEDPDKSDGSDEQKLDAFREARDELKAHIEQELLAEK